MQLHQEETGAAQYRAQTVSQRRPVQTAELSQDPQSQHVSRSAIRQTHETAIPSGTGSRYAATISRSALRDQKKKKKKTDCIIA